MNRTENRPCSVIALALSLAVLFLITHPYTGIRHDAILYTAQALYNAHPENFSHDLFFEYGSQDQWTIYGRIFAKIVSAFGLRASNLAGLIVAQALWWSGIWRLTKRLLPEPWHWLSLCLIACMPSDYGAGLIFSYDEGFLTARLPAEALGLWAIALMFDRRYRMAIALALVATAVHPLIGGVSLVFVVLDRMPRVTWWRLLPLALIAFAVVEMPAFKALHLYPFDPAWRSIAQFNVPFLFPTLWSVNAWSKACWAIAVPAMLCATRVQDHRTQWSTLTLIGVAGVALTTIADLTGQDAVWIQLQPWRVLWLLTLMQWPAAILLVRRERHARPTLIWLLAICWLLIDVGGGIVALAIAAALHAAARWPALRAPRALRGDFAPALRYTRIGVTLVAAIVWIVFQCAYQVSRIQYPTGSVMLDLPWLETLIHTHLVVTLIALLAMLNLSRNRIAVVGLPVILAAFAAYGLVNIDQRSEPTKIMEAGADRADFAPFEGTVARGNIVYWDGPADEVVYPWLMMRTSSYYSPAQAAGLIFHRRTTFEALRRLELIKQDPYAARPRGNHDAGQKSTVFVSKYEYLPLTRTGIRHICADPVLDFIVSHQRYPELATRYAWSPEPNSTVWLYDCRSIRTTAAGQDASLVYAQPASQKTVVPARPPTAFRRGASRPRHAQVHDV
ncbi:hypothetical protein BLA13014_03996 [Burkholderia aenigmatica]|uniref:Transmembrane protein n=1 Tax=Burkholderia aenigmatica TaxID=2015348 RepID=A0A6P2N5X4_9BURK|nr:MULTISPECIES: hypothetical protein [Burkholderia]VWB86470.1 hypothetical protein BLA13014_03996 [Burkholderia aenigmatica]